MNAEEHLQQLFQQNVNMDYSEKLSEELSPSAENKRFIEIMNNSITKVDGHITALGCHGETLVSPCQITGTRL